MTAAEHQKQTHAQKAHSLGTEPSSRIILWLNRQTSGLPVNPFTRKKDNSHDANPSD
jgi:hypothetical protein